MFAGIDPWNLAISFVVLLFSLSVHEASHASAAYLLEDDTAAVMGRMTLNPIAHIDPIGTILFPLIGMTTGLRILGWAKPVPVNVSRLTRRFTMRTGYAMVAAAGPASNVVLSVLTLLITTVSLRFSVPDQALRWELFRACFGGHEGLQELGRGPMGVVFLALAGRMMVVNFGLAVFNLLPIGPLDGAAVLGGFLPYTWAQKMDRYKQHMYVALVALVFLGGMRYLFNPLYDLYFQFLGWIGPFLLGV